MDVYLPLFLPSILTTAMARYFFRILINLVPCISTLKQISNQMWFLLIQANLSFIHEGLVEALRESAVMYLNARLVVVYLMKYNKFLSSKYKIFLVQQRFL